MPSVLDRNARARLLFQAEALDRRTRLPGQHGGVLKRSGLQVLRTLLFSFANVITGRCDPSYDTLARAAGVARSTVAVALRRLEQAGLIKRVRRQLQHRRISNSYRFPAVATAESESRPQTTNNLKTPRSKARANPLVPDSLTPAEARAALRDDHQRIVRARAVRLAGQTGQPAAT